MTRPPDRLADLGVAAARAVRGAARAVKG
ncbi:MAG: hypothetical protein JWN47_819, partial [Frankiales bacterium]|nr:hypothetical protein [Frankiales bacterium]